MAGAVVESVPQAGEGLLLLLLQLLGAPSRFADATKTFFTASRKSAANVRSNFCLIDSNRKKENHAHCPRRSCCLVVAGAAAVVVA